MNLADILAPERTHIADRVNSKKRALEQTAALLAEGTPYLTAGEVFSGLVAREKLGSTALGDGVAIPHTRMPGIDDCVGACVRFPQAVAFDAHDDASVDLVFGLLVPEQATQAHLELLRHLAQQLGDPTYLATLRAATSDCMLFDRLAHRPPFAFPHAG